MLNPVDTDAAVKVLQQIIEELEVRLNHPENYSQREIQHQRELLNHRRLEMADLLDQTADDGDLP